MDQEPGGHHADVAGETRAHCGVGHADRRRVTDLWTHTAPSAALSPGAPAAIAREQGPDSYPHGGCRDVSLYLSDDGATTGRKDNSPPGVWVARPSRDGV